ncbi:protein transport protein Sec16B [Ornithorhynchus anatinus]|uniref:protein transport protein Sec16B n=1 Tax=Ornithorhynchus anatinus TaxID=9258 RepID=UPI0010A870BE|nr:protein transport protein Sec16B [Ornithorhynchus anatinus]XP_028936430.1 protein transport protein Sec16B [Ornithorhynchus anatinus]XP_028936432.1 protein transport protein Sec16B [Ornithorhynchus anatinus]XP_028936433.1 protein transport protein Sec16B [Ornithorhynchus anatinus]XP_039770263.1 protein transport protein Sec16B [Ornithorhynchus anatinus]
MEPWAPLQQSHPWGRSAGLSKSPDQEPQKDGYPKPTSHPGQNGEGHFEHLDQKGDPLPWPDPQGDCQQPAHPDGPAEPSRPETWARNYEGELPYLSFPRLGYQDPYQNYPSPRTREEYSYGGFYRGHPDLCQEERVPKPGSPYIRHEDYWYQNYIGNYRHDHLDSSFDANSDSQPWAKNYDAYKVSPTPGSKQEKPGGEHQDVASNVLEEEEASREYKELSRADEPSMLQHYKDSGLSSSSYELSQYMPDPSDHSYPMHSESWNLEPADDTTSDNPTASMKYSVPHVPVCFGPGGQLVRVCPNSPTDGQTALVEVHSLEVILSDTKEQEDMRAFSGPLIREDVHKVDVMTFCQKKAALCRELETPRGKESALLWQLLVLLCRQNGSMVGSDTAELLMQDCKTSEKYKLQAPPAANLINLTDEDLLRHSSQTPNLLTGEVPPRVATRPHAVEKFTKLLFYGRKKEALEWAMKNHLWGHALFLSSKMDQRTYTWVMSGFTSTLAPSDPLQTLFQLMSGRIPQAAMSCGDRQWGDWRPHLAVMLSNQAGDAELNKKAIVTMGDTLAGKGLVEAAHICYLMARVPFGHYARKTDHLTLLGSSHSQAFIKFATMEAIQRTEIFEYCQTLGRPKSFIPSFQVYKLIYASRLADYGLTSQALYYCEGISSALLSQTESKHPVLLVELIKLAERLQLSDPLLLERPRRGKTLEPDWLVHLRDRHKELEVEKHKESRGEYNPAILRISESDTTVCQDPGQSRPQVYPSYVKPLPAGQSRNPPGLWEHHPSSQPGPRPVGGQPGQSRKSGPLYATPEVYPPASSHMGAVLTSPERVQYSEAPSVPSESQSSLIPRARSISRTSTISLEEEDREGMDSVDDAEEKALGTNGVEENSKSLGFGWLSWFRSKSTNTVAPIEEKNSWNGSEPETLFHPQEMTPAASLSPFLSPSLPHSGANPFSRSENGAMRVGDKAVGLQAGGVPMTEGISRDLYFGPRTLPPPPPPPVGAVPLYNPSQISQLTSTMATGLNRTSRLAQRRYPAQP